MDIFFSPGAPVPLWIRGMGLPAVAIVFSHAANALRGSALRRRPLGQATGPAPGVEPNLDKLRGLGIRLHMPQGEPSRVKTPPPTQPGPTPPLELPPNPTPDVTEPPVPLEQPPIQVPPSSPGEIVAAASGAKATHLASPRKAKAPSAPPLKFRNMTKARHSVRGQGANHSDARSHRADLQRRHRIEGTLLCFEISVAGY